MQTPTSTIPRSPQQAINSLSPGDRRVLNENELAQRWGVSPKTLQRWRSAVSYTHLTLPTKEDECRSRWSPYH